MDNDDFEGWEDLKKVDDGDDKSAYWRLDETENALDYLDAAVQALMETDRNPWAWKRVFTNLHAAIYGFGVCAVTGSDYHRVTKKRKSGERYLKTFNQILQMCQSDDWMGQYTHSETLKLTKEQKDAIAFIKDTMRNPLAHFVPRVWYVETAGLPDKISCLFDVIEFLAVDSGNVFFHNRENGHQRVHALCESGRQLAEATGAENSNSSRD